MCFPRASLPSSLLLEAAWGLEYLHVKGKVHRDVKAANVIVVGGDGGENSLTAKVADFGMTCGKNKA